MTLDDAKKQVQSLISEARKGRDTEWRKGYIDGLDEALMILEEVDG